MRRITIRRFFQHEGRNIASVTVEAFGKLTITTVSCEELIQLGQECKDHEIGLAHDMTEEEKQSEMERMKRAEEDEDAEEYRQSLDEPDFEFEDSFYGEQK
tara:strand:- start:1934 stop:2236 length:303 start_codon:yes stop_codon:yes gene_type:complete